MWRYQHPDFALFLLGELQKQQQGSIFCDTLLQTEGVCVPAHSCVLAALSPVFSRILSSSPAPHAGQSRLLNLEAVGSHVLLKLVGFLYTGEMEIESRREHEEVMAAALRLGLRNIFGKKRVLLESGVGRHWREAAMQTEDTVRSRESEVVPEPLKIQSSTATSVQPCDLLEPALPPSSLFDEAFPTRGFNLNDNIAVPELTEASVSTHHKTKAKKRWKMAKRESQLKKCTRQQNQITVLNVEGSMSNPIGIVEKSRNISGKDFRRLLETDNRQNSAVPEQKEAKVDQLKVKIKLRRRRGACWESNLLVSVQGESEKKPEEAKESGSRTQICPSSVLPGQSLGTLTPPTDLPISPSNSSTHASSDKCLHTPHHISVFSPLEVPALSASPPQTDESDEHIAMLLEDMFMMGLNILPLMPLDRNLDEQDQLGSLQEQKGGQRGAEGSSQNTCLFVQSCELEMRESDVCQTPAPDGSPGQGDEGHLSFQNQSRCSTAKLLESPGQDSLNKVNNLGTVERNSIPPLVEDTFLTHETTADKPSPATDVMASLPDYRSDFKLLQCLSPLETEKGDSDVPTQELSEPSHSQDLEPQKLPLWLSESPLILDFPLSSMIDSSSPRLQRDLSVCKNQSSPDLAEKEEFKTSFTHNDLISGSNSSIIQLDVSNASKLPKQRKKRRRRLATRRSKGKKAAENEDQVQLKISKCDDMPTSNVCRVSTRLSSANRNVATAVKRRQDISSPCRKKMPRLRAVCKQHEHVNILAKPNVSGVVKHRRGRPPKSKETQVCLCNNAQKMPISGQNDCEVEKNKPDREIEQGKKQEPHMQQEKDSLEMEEADVNSNSSQTTTLNSHIKYANQSKGSSILDQIFHQTLPNLACKSSLIIDQQQTSSLRDTSFCIQRFRVRESKDENSKLVMNGSEQINKGMCAEIKAETSTLMNHSVDEEVYDNQRRSPLCGDMPDNEKCSVKNGDVTTENRSFRTTTVVQNEMGKEIQDQMTEISVPFTSDEDIMTDIILPVDDADHAELPKTEGVGTTNLDLKQFIERSEATVSDELSFEVTDSEQNTLTAHVVSCENIFWVADSLENNDKGEDFGMHKEIEMIEETMEGEETEVKRGHEFVKENALLASGDACWETTTGWDDGNTDSEGGQYCAEMIDGHIQEELSEGHIASAKIEDDPPNAVLTLKETEEIISTDVCIEDASTLLSNGSSSESKEDQLDEEDVEVDVLGEFLDSPLGLLAAKKVMTLTIESPLDQEDEFDATEEEEVDVTGEESG